MTEKKETIYSPVYARKDQEDHSEENIRPGEPCGGRIRQINETCRMSYTSLLMEAAVLNQPDRVLSLLENGWDCNGNDLSEMVLAPICDMKNTQRFSGDPSNRCYIEDTVVINCCTPLAAAIISGSLDAAKVLSGWRGVWKAESSAVSHAVAIAFEPDQLACVAAVFGEELGEFSEEALFSTVKFLPGAFAEMCNVSRLEYQLKAGLYSDDDVREALRAQLRQSFFLHKPDEIIKRTLLIAEYRPDVCREEWAKGTILRIAASACRHGVPYKELLDSWKKLCDGIGDISWMWGALVGVTTKKFAPFFDYLSDHMDLVMDADTVDWWMPVSVVKKITKKVRVYSSQWREGVSGLAMNVLSCRNWRWVKNAIENGALDGESREEVLRCLKEANGDFLLRVLALTEERIGTKRMDVIENVTDLEYHQNGVRYGLHHWQERNDQNLAQIAEKLYSWMREPTEEDPFLDWRVKKVFFEENFGIKEEVRFANQMVMDACQADNSAMLEKLLEIDPTLSRCFGNYDFSFQGDDSLLVCCALKEAVEMQASALCWAAAAGKTQNVELLLRKNGSPDEIDRGIYSSIRIGIPGEVRYFRVTPLLMALACNQEDTARILISAGAKLDVEQYAVRRLIDKIFGDDARALTERLLGVSLAEINPKDNTK